MGETAGHTHTLRQRLVTHGDYRAETHFSLFDALVGRGDFGQRIRFCNHFNFAGGGDLERFVEKSRLFCWLPRTRIRRAMRSPGWTGSGLFSIPMSTRRPSGRSPAMLSAMASTELLVPEDHIGAACCSKTLAITDNVVGTQFANHFVLICRARDGDRNEPGRGGKTSIGPCSSTDHWNQIASASKKPTNGWQRSPGTGGFGYEVPCAGDLCFRSRRTP
jgi:hypothetical protein